MDDSQLGRNQKEEIPKQKSKKEDNPESENDRVHQRVEPRRAVYGGGKKDDCISRAV